MRTLRTLLAAVAFVLCAVPASLSASPPAEIPVRAYLTNDNGEPLDRQVDVEISVYTSQSGGGLVHTESFDVRPDQGRFTAYLGMNQSLDLGIFQKHDALFLGIKVGDDTEMTPRLRLATAPYAAAAKHAETANDAQTAEQAKRADRAKKADEAKTLQGKKPSDFASANYQPAWKDIKNRPSGRCNGEKTMVGLKSDGSPICQSPDSVQAGEGLRQSGDTIAVEDGGIQAKHLDKGQVTSDTIRTGAVRGGQDGIVSGTPNEIKDDTINSFDLEENGVDSTSLADDAVGRKQLADDAVTKSHIASNAVVGGRNKGNIKNETITGWDVKNRSIGRYEMKKGSVRSKHIRDGSVQPRDMGWYGACGYYVWKNSYDVIIPNAQAAKKLPPCKKTAPGSFCESDGECNLPTDLNNLGKQDVVLRLN